MWHQASTYCRWRTCASKTVKTTKEEAPSLPLPASPVCVITTGWMCVHAASVSVPWDCCRKTEEWAELGGKCGDVIKIIFNSEPIGENMNEHHHSTGSPSGPRPWYFVWPTVCKGLPILCPYPPVRGAVVTRAILAKPEHGKDSSAAASNSLNVRDHHWGSVITNRKGWITEHNVAAAVSCSDATRQTMCRAV